MSFEYLSVQEAIPRRGLRMVVLGKVPSPWGESAKGIFHLKRVAFSAVRLAHDDETLKSWAGQISAPVAILDDEPPRSGWAEILMLAERLAPTPPLLPAEPQARANALILADEFCGPRGLGWNRRLQLVHAGLTGTNGFGGRVAGYLGAKYGYVPGDIETYNGRVIELLRRFAAVLQARRAAGELYYLAQLSAVDVYSAAFMGMFKPLPPAQCDMHPGLRAAFEWLDEATAAALDPVLIEHRDMMYARHLELPLAL